MKLKKIPPRQWLLNCIKALADRASNPVLELLHGIARIETERTYPDPEMTFANHGMHAFYHCHDAPGRPDDEHGHFHIYVHTSAKRTQAAQSVHLAALSMDRHGQPLRWFSLNRWVTGGIWLGPAQSIALIPTPASDQGLSLTESWLLAMLHVYRHELTRLLEERDRIVPRLTSGTNPEQLLEQQEFYELSTSPVDLLAKFKQT